MKCDERECATCTIWIFVTGLFELLDVLRIPTNKQEDIMINIEDYPEHKKLQEFEDELRSVVDFLHWVFKEKRCVFAKKRLYRSKIAYNTLGVWVLEDYFDIDIDKLMVEKQRLEEMI